MKTPLGSIAARTVSCIVFGSFVLVSHSAHASLTLQLVNGLTTVTCADGDACDSNALPGVVVFSGTVGSFSVLSATGFSDGPSVADIDLGSSVLSSSAGTLKISLSDVFSLDDTTGFGSVNFGGTTKGTVTEASYFGDSLFSTTDPIGSPLGPFGPGSFSGTTSGALAGLDDPFFLTSVVTITHPAGRNLLSSFDAETEVAVPSPSTLSLLGAGLAALGLFGWRKRHKAATA